EIDISRDRFPYCIVWTQLPVLSWLLPFIGHVGICDSGGKVHDFAGPYYVSVDNMAFARPKKYMLMYPGDRERAVWDEAIDFGDTVFRERMHNLFCNNCHHHVVACLNHLRYGGVRNWNQFALCWLLMVNGHDVSWKATVQIWALFVSIVVLI
ncbi:conserved hypothetical protein, partial [Perkinsus marinus ATCC 50983]